MDKDSSRKPVNLRIAKSADDNGSQGDSKKQSQNAIVIIAWAINRTAKKRTEKLTITGEAPRCSSQGERFFRLKQPENRPWLLGFILKRCSLKLFHGTSMRFVSPSVSPCANK